MCLVITILHIYKTFLSFQEVLLDSIVLECKVQEGKDFFSFVIFVLSILTALLRCNLHNINLTSLKYTI